MARLLVTGTGTEVGKTVVACVIANGLRASGGTVAVYKPVMTGTADAGPHGPDHERLRRAAGSAQSDAEISPYRYEEPVSPHLAAERAGERIDPSLLLEGAERARSTAEHFVCEGVGGLMVPLAPDYLLRDFVRDLALPVVIVASPGLGTINHTLLTIDAARSAGLEVTRVVLTPWPREPSQMEESNRETIADLRNAPVVTLPDLDLTAPATWPTDLGARLAPTL